LGTERLGGERGRGEDRIGEPDGGETARADGGDETARSIPSGESGPSNTLMGPEGGADTSGESMRGKGEPRPSDRGGERGKKAATSEQERCREEGEEEAVAEEEARGGGIEDGSSKRTGTR